MTIRAVGRRAVPRIDLPLALSLALSLPLVLALPLPFGRAAAAEPAPPRPAAVPARVAVADVLVSEALPPALKPSRAAAGEPRLADLRLAYPLARAAEQEDPWAWRYSESRGRWRMHTGLDLAAEQGTPVLAALAGRVLLVEVLPGYGLSVLLDHGEGLQTLYAHLRQASVLLGQGLERGEPLGEVGMTGSATGPHLHFELRHQADELLAMDPSPHLLPALVAPPPALPRGLLAADP